MIRTLADRAVLTSPLPLVTAREARLLGLRLTPATWSRVRTGVYVDRRGRDGLAPWQRYALRVHAFHRRHPDAVMCLESAAVLLGLPIFGEPRDIHVLADGDAKSRRSGDVVVHSGTDPRQLILRGTIRSTALVDTALDLARVLPPAKALAVADSSSSAFQGGDVDIADAIDANEHRLDARGRARGRWVWSNADARAESPVESISRAVIGWSGFETPELQVGLDTDGTHDRADFLFPRRRVIGEADGWGKYNLHDPVEAAARLTAEKRREDRLRRAGHPFARWDLADALQVAPLQRALSAAGVAVVRPSSPALLASLSIAPRETRRRGSRTETRSRT